MQRWQWPIPNDTLKPESDKNVEDSEIFLTRDVFSVRLYIGS